MKGLDPQTRLKQELEAGLSEIQYFFDVLSRDDSRLVDEITRIYTNANKEINPEMIKQALRLTTELHKYDDRDSGDPFALHPVEVGYVLTALRKIQKEVVNPELERLVITTGVKEPIIHAGIFHDTKEENPGSTSLIYSVFSNYRYINYVLKLVDVLTPPEIEDTVRKKHELYKQIREFTKEYVQKAAEIIEVVDTLLNLRTVDKMQSKRGLTAKQRQIQFIDDKMDNVAPMAGYIDGSCYFDLKLRQYIEEIAEAQNKLIRDINLN